MKAWKIGVLKSLSHRWRNIILTSLIVLFMYIHFFMVVRPLRIKVLKQREQIVSLRESRQRGRLILGNKVEVERQWAFFSNEYMQKINNEQQMADLLSQIEKLATESNLSLEDMKPQKIKMIDSYNKYSVELMLNGGLNNLVRFMCSLQNTPYLFSVEELRLEKTSSPSSSLRCFLVVSRIMIPS